MGSITNTELAILGLLAESAGHGYQIEQLIETRGFREWTEIGFSSIYYALNRLEEAGWLESAVGTAAGGTEPLGTPAKASAEASAEALAKAAAESEVEPAQAGASHSARGRAKRSGPARRIYRLTNEGWEAYRAGVRERLAHPRPRSGDFDLALANLPALPPVEARAALETCRAGLRARLEAVRARWQQDRTAQEFLPEHVEALFDHAAAGLAAELAWIDKFLKD